VFLKRFIKKVDFVLIAVLLCILVYGLLIVGTAGTSAAWIREILEQRGIQQNTMEYLWQASLWDRLSILNLYLVKRQAVWIMLSIVLVAAVIYFPYNDLKKHIRKIYILNLVMLGSVLVMGYEALGAQRWIELGPFSFQPSEFSKILLIICLASYLSSREGKLKHFRDLIPCFVYVGVPMSLILLQPDLGTSLVFMAILFGMLYAAGARPVLLAGIVGSGLTLGIGSVWAHLKFGTWLPLHEYQLARLTIFLDPWKDFQGAGYHMIQSQIAIGSSGLTGKGLLRGTQSLGQFLPIPESDFIFSVLSEQLGFLGALLLLCLYFTLLYRVLLISRGAKDTFGMLLAVGVVSMFSFHIFINAGMTLGIMPVTGLPLPLFSYGGSNMITNMIALGLVLNVCIRREKILF